MGTLQDRLNKIIPRLTSDELLNNQGLGNEIGFYIFDYPPENELEVRDYLQVVLKHLSKKKAGIRVKHINLFALIIDYLKEAKFLDKAIALQKDKGNQALMKALKGPLDSKKIAQVFTVKADPDNHDLILISGVGSAWPLLRSHNLLNNLHPMMGSTPLVMFYPGEYTGAGMKLFGRMKESNYYRAFQLVP
ncbi:MAG: cytoplasmic protein [Deltaproteobacteria bacterium RIFOXYD12_FULL_50_9]|nr:MAG: cytoplasmic protein [Deltaproteobacteria bacterium RIFOXYD12_FULL_50_9]